MAEANQRIGILHLSDVQFGPNHRFTQGVDSLAERLAPALRELPDEARPIHVIVFSGDAAERGLPEEFAAAAAFLRDVLAELELAADRLVIVPGNHDINRDAVQGQIFAARAAGGEAEPPYERKWDNYRAFLREARGAGGSDKLDDVHQFADLGLTISALNSTVGETHEEHYGFCGEEQLEKHAKALAQSADNLRIAVVHHNVRQAAADDTENLRDERDLVRILGAHVDLVLHGHRHAAGRDHLRNGRLILSTGSTALMRDQRPEETPNQFQVLALTPEQVERWAYCFDPKEKRWIVDAAVGQGVPGYESIRLGTSGPSDVRPCPQPEPPPLEVPPAPVSAPADPLSELAENPQIDEAEVTRFRSDVREDAATIGDRNLTPKEMLGRMSLLRNGAVTRGAVLLFGQAPQRELPSAFVQCVRYFGPEQAADRESIRVEGTARNQIDDALTFLRERISRRERPGLDRARAEVAYAYPMTCLREVVVNAVVHRDYADDQRNVHVRLFSDRIEVASPGSLWTKRDVDGGAPLSDIASQSVKRNPRLAHAMALIRYFEGEGSGIPTAVRDAVAVGATPPTVSAEDGFVVVTIFPSQFDPEAIDAVLGRAERSTGDYLTGARGRRVRVDDVYVEQMVAPLDKPDLLLPADRLASEERPILLLGAPGVGKSTLMARLARNFAHSRSIVPIRLGARDMLEVFDRPADLATLVHDVWLRDGEPEVSAASLRAIFERSLSVLLIDGLDELRAGAQREQVVDVVAAALAAYSRMRVIVTSRPIELPDAMRGWARFELQPWTSEDVGRYLEQMGAAAGLDEATRVLLRLQVSSDPRLSSLAAIPLLGATIVEVYGEYGRLPSSRFELLQTATNLLVERWDVVRGIANTAGGRGQREALRAIALAAFREGIPFDALPWAWCVKQVEPIATYSRVTPEKFLISATERGSLLARTGADLIGFRVLALAELLAGEGLDRSVSTESDLIEAAVDAGLDDRTRVIGELALLSRVSHSHVQKLALTLVKHARLMPLDRRAAAVDLAASMIEDGVESPGTQEAFAAAVRELEDESGGAGVSSRIRRVAARLEHTG